jgi:hypothetical protein
MKKRLAILYFFRNDFIDLNRLFKHSDVEICLFTWNDFENNYSEHSDKIISYEQLRQPELCFWDLIKEHEDSNFTKIISFTEREMIVAAAVREYLGIEGQSLEDATNFRDKYIMKNYVSKLVKTAFYFNVDSIIDIHKFISLNGYPFIIKPRLGAGSKNVSIIENDIELRKYISSNSIKESLIESLVEGTEYHVDGIYDPERDKFKFFCASKYLVPCLDYQKGEYLGSVIIEDNSYFYHKIKTESKKVLSKLVRNRKAPFCFHGEFFQRENGDLIFSELSPRSGGGQINSSIKSKYGVDLTLLDIAFQIDEKIGNQIFNSDFKKNNKNIGWVSVPPHVKITAPYSNNKNVIDSFINEHNKEKKSKQAKSSVDYQIAHVVSAHSELELNDTISTIIDWYNGS